MLVLLAFLLEILVILVSLPVIWADCVSLNRQHLTVCPVLYKAKQYREVNVSALMLESEDSEALFGVFQSKGP